MFYFIYFERTYDIIKIIKLLEDLNVSIDGIVKHEIKIQKSLVLLHPLSKMEITKYFIYESRFNGIFSRNNLPRVKDGVYVINLDDKEK